MNKLKDLCCYAFSSKYEDFNVWQLPTTNFVASNDKVFQFIEFIVYIPATNRRYKSVLYKYLEGR